MERTKQVPLKKASAILMGDVHLREDQPICRTDDVWAAQWRKIDFISDLQKKHGCPVLCSGDLFDYWKPSPNLLTWASEHLPDQFYSIYGQHDLPQHNMELAHKSGLYNLWKNRKLFILPECHFGQTPTSEPPYPYCFPEFEKRILVWHQMVYQGKLPWPGCTDPMAAKLLRKYPQYSLICTGDNHKPFVEEHQGRILVNVGSMMRTTADQIDYRPAVWLWYAETNTVEKVYLPIEDNVISREHLEIKEQRDNRMNAFIEKMDDSWEAGLSFEQNLEEFKKTNKVKKSIMNIIYQSLD